MNISLTLNTHKYDDVVKDTISSIETFLTEDIIVTFDGEFKTPASIKHSHIKGFSHGSNVSPYRNVALGMSALTEKYDSDWYCYCEYDVLFGSSRIRRQLEVADKYDVRMLGSNGRVDHVDLSIFKSLFKDKKMITPYYFLGCCLFFSKTFMNQLKSIDFFNKFLFLTNSFGNKVPCYSGYDISEHLYPTLCKSYGGGLGVLSTFHQGEWHGPTNHYPMRWKPDLTLGEGFRDASIMHPIKDYDNSLREHHRIKRRGYV